LATRERVRTWIMRRGAQLHVQHERWEAEEEYQRAMEKREPRLIRPSDRHQQTGQTAGMIREEAVRTEGLWVGVVRTEAGRSASPASGAAMSSTYCSGASKRSRQQSGYLLGPRFRAFSTSRKLLTATW